MIREGYVGIVAHRGKEHRAGLVDQPDILPEGRGWHHGGPRITLMPGQAGPPGGVAGVVAEVVVELLDPGCRDQSCMLYGILGTNQTAAPPAGMETRAPWRPIGPGNRVAGADGVPEGIIEVGAGAGDRKAKGCRGARRNSIRKSPKVLELNTTLPGSVPPLAMAKPRVSPEALRSLLRVMVTVSPAVA